MDLTVTGATDTTGNRGFERDHSWKILHAIGDVRSDVKEAEADVRSDVKDAESSIKTTSIQQQLDNNNNFRSIENTLSRNAAVAAKDAQDILYRLHDNIRTVTDTILVQNSLTQTKVLESQYAVAEKINALERRNDNQFTLAALAAEKNTSSILKEMDAKERRSIQDELNELREEKNYIRGCLHSEQMQKATQQAINFGTGVIGQSSTANQVR